MVKMVIFFKNSKKEKTQRKKKSAEGDVKDEKQQSKHETNAKPKNLAYAIKTNHGDADIWVADSGASLRITNNPDLFIYEQ